MNLHKEIEKIIHREQLGHPLASRVRLTNVEKLLSQYLALCQCAPYIIGGANKDLFMHAIESGRKIDHKIEITTAVSNFLSFDETGNYEKVKKHGDAALIEFTNSDNFHYNILKKDLSLLFKREIAPTVSPELISYFKVLSSGLSSLNDIQRCACLVALEVHSEVMIKSLWGSLLILFPDYSGSKLMYFYLHVGGENPAERYHVEMTENMIQSIVPERDMKEFWKYFEEYYVANLNLCQFFINNS